MQMFKERLTENLTYCAQIYNGCVPFCGGTTYSWSNDTEYCMNIKNNTMTIVFRGTDSKKEWLSNLAFCKKVIPYGNYESDVRVHGGFITAYKNKLVRDRIHSLISDKPCRIIVTGHSRGAALAVLCAVDLQYNFPDKSISVTTYGCPRVGNAAFAKSYNKRVTDTVRVENGNDIVTKVPPAIFGFRHVGARFGVGNTRLPFLFSFNAHYPVQYLRGIINRLY